MKTSVSVDSTPPAARLGLMATSSVVVVPNCTGVGGVGVGLLGGSVGGWSGGGVRVSGPVLVLVKLG